MVFLDIRFDELSIHGVLNLIFESAPSTLFRYIVTPNVDHVLRIASDARCAALYSGAWLCINDSKILRALSVVRRTPLSTVPGSDLVAALLTDTRLPHDTPLLVVGGPDHLPADLERRLGLTRVAQYRPPMGLLGDAAALDETVRVVERADARFVLLAIGSPQQEMVAAAVAARNIATGIGLCIGAGVEYMLEHRRRAPLWMRRASLEWLYRLILEPRRLWRRYLVDGPRIFHIFASHMLKAANSRDMSSNG